MAEGYVIKDSNGNSINAEGVTVQKSHTFVGSNATVVVPLFRITGNVEIKALYGVVTTDLGSNHTAAAFRLNDQTAQVDITLNTGVTMSSLKAGSMIAKKGLAAAAAVAINNSAGRVNEPTTLETKYFGDFVVTKKTGANTDIEYVYATTQTPTTGAMTFYCRYIPLSADATVAPV